MTPADAATLEAALAEIRSMRRSVAVLTAAIRERASQPEQSDD